MVQPRAWWGLLGVLIVAAGFFFTGITWGLPSRASDRFLFGDRTPWTGQQILALAGGWDESAGRGSDIAMHPLQRRDRPIVLNATDAERAAIVRRFRLYSCQPDEMITFRALSRMKPSHGDLDPQFFQYGGLWVYPVGILLRLAAAVHRVTLRSDLAFYLDHPEAFGRFYVVARCYSAGWGLVGVVVVWQIARTWTGRVSAAVLASLLFATMPVVVNAAHEAKPHLAGSVLTLLTVLLAMRYLQSGRTRTAVLAGVAAGAAFGMILTGVYAFAVLPVAVLLRPLSWPQRVRVLLLAGGVGAIVFIATNPYLPFDYLFRRQVVQSNVGNYGNFYKPQLSFESWSNSLHLLMLGMCPPTGFFGFLAIAIVAAGRARRLAALLAAPALLVWLQFVLLAKGKPAEYARFALTADVALAITLGVALVLVRRAVAIPIAILCILSTSFDGAFYVIGSVRDKTRSSTREAAARLLEGIARPGEKLAVWAEPAPYCMPPVDLFRWQLLLLPPGVAAGPAGANASVIATDRPVDSPPNQLTLSAASRLPHPISWADKPFDVRLYRWAATSP